MLYMMSLKTQMLYWIIHKLQTIKIHRKHDGINSSLAFLIVFVFFATSHRFEWLSFWRFGLSQIHGCYFSTALPNVELKSRRTCFWRRQKGCPDTYLATIEAVYYFLKDLHSHYFSEYTGEYDNLLFFFSFCINWSTKPNRLLGKCDERERLVCFIWKLNGLDAVCHSEI